MEAKVAEFYLTNGVLGVSVLVLLIAVGVLFKLYMGARDRTEEVQEARLTDAKAFAETLRVPLRNAEEFQNSLLEYLSDREKRNGHSNRGSRA